MCGCTDNPCQQYQVACVQFLQHRFCGWWFLIPTISCDLWLAQDWLGMSLGAYSLCGTVTVAIVLSCAVTVWAYGMWVKLFVCWVSIYVWVSCTTSISHYTKSIIEFHMQCTGFSHILIRTIIQSNTRHSHNDCSCMHWSVYSPKDESAVTHTILECGPLRYHCVWSGVWEHHS